MSELIQNHDERQRQLKEIVQKINAGTDLQRVKRDFHSMIKQVSPEEIAELEQGLIREGVPVEQVQELCDLHVEVFQGALERAPRKKVLPGHPVHTYRMENRTARRKAKALAVAARRVRGSAAVAQTAFDDLKTIELHYQRKENQLFPFLERVGFTGPSKVMWGKHDEIRAALRETGSRLANLTAADGGVSAAAAVEFRRLVGRLVSAIRRMIFMEERILFPTSLKKLPENAWAEIRTGEAEIGYAWVQPGNLWDPNVLPSRPVQPSGAEPAGTVPLDVGALTAEQLNLMLKALPVDITFVDERNKVCYYSGSEHRIFPRSPGIIGREVANCHPPKSVHVVERIVSAFRKRERESADFWFTVEGRQLHIRYLPVYNDSGNYRGTVEFSQDVTGIRALEGERKLLDWED